VLNVKILYILYVELNLITSIVVVVVVVVAICGS
jgi:hypothetical protein